MMTRRTIGVATGVLLAGALLLGGASATLARSITAAPTSGMMGESSGGMMGGGSGGMMGNGAQATMSYDLRFMDDMIMHHEGAIMSARMMIGQSAHPALRDLARRIIAGQQAQIDQMRAWTRQWYHGKDAGPTSMGSGGMMGSGMGSGSNGMMGGGTGSGSNGMMGGTMGSGSDGMMGSATSAHLFLLMMIPHHQVAIDMSRDALVHAQHPLLKGLARSIIRDQSAQITEMEGYLKAWYGETGKHDPAGPLRGVTQRPVGRVTR